MNRITAIIVGVLLLVVLGQYIHNSVLSAKLEKAEELNDVYFAQLKENKVWKDEAGLWRNKAEAAQASASALKEMVKRGDPEIKKIREEFSAINKDFSNLASYSEFQAKTISELRGKLKDSTYNVVTGKDTIPKKVKKLSVWNSWNIYDVTIDGDSANIKRQGIEEFETAVYWERVTKKGNKTFWPFGKKKWSSEIKSLNPETQVVKQRSLIVGRKK